MTESKAMDAAGPESRRGGASLADGRLLSGVRQRDPAALGHFFDLAFPYVYSLAYRMLGERSSAEDVAQDVFLKVHRSAPGLHVDRDARPWLTRIAMNACRDALRRRQVRRAESDEAALARVPSPVSSPADQAQHQEQQQRLRRALAHLDEDQRSVILLRNYSGCSHEQIADVLGIQQAAVRKRYSRALERLRAWLETP